MVRVLVVRLGVWWVRVRRAGGASGCGVRWCQVWARCWMAVGVKRGWRAWVVRRCCREVRWCVSIVVKGVVVEGVRG